MNAVMERPIAEVRMETVECCPWCRQPQVLCTLSSCDDELETYPGIYVGGRWVRPEEVGERLMSGAAGARLAGSADGERR
jgi:hypothetical protein